MLAAGGRRHRIVRAVWSSSPHTQIVHHVTQTTVRLPPACLPHPPAMVKLF